RVYELYEEIPWEVAACTIFKGYTFRVVFQPSDGPQVLKTLSRLQWLPKPEWFRTLAGKTLLYTSECQDWLEIDTPSAGFGLNTTPDGVGFGSTPFGDPSPLVVDVNPIVDSHSTAAQFFIGFETTEAYMQLRLQGLGRKLEASEGPASRGR